MTNSNIGPHLLGRNPSKPDARDFKVSTFLSTDPLDIALASLLKSSTSKATKAWAQVATERIKGLNPSPSPVPPTPSPTPTPVNTDKVWIDSDAVLDQGETGHCVGFGSAQWGNTDPVNDNYNNDDGHKLYYECKIIDGEPNQENGSEVRSGMKALQNRGRLSTYASATTLEEIKTWVQTKGSVVIGSDWMNDMFDPDSKGYIKPTGGYAGGHCYLLVGDLISEGAFEFQNSWGDSWGLNGRFKMKYADFQTLLDNQGEAWVAIELDAA